jgi:hypothetical protein
VEARDAEASLVDGGILDGINGIFLRFTEFFWGKGLQNFAQRTEEVTAED